MIEVKGYFSDNENILIYNLNNYFAELANPHVDGKVINNGDFVRYELNISEEENDTHLILQFCIRDNEDVEDGCCNFVHISNIVIPHSLTRQAVAKWESGNRIKCRDRCYPFLAGKLGDRFRSCNADGSTSSDRRKISIPLGIQGKQAGSPLL